MAANRRVAVSRRRLLATLKKVFRIARLREGQEAVIQRIMSGLSTLAVMPTGAGKSLCYQLPALLLPHKTVVVSPLIALMKDQCDGLVELGIEAVQVHSGIEAQALRDAMQRIQEQRVRIVFTTPERLADVDFLTALKRHPSSLLVVDEAHCISQWGHDFRPAFLDIGAAAQALGHPVVLALTATANARVADDVREQLGIPKAGTVNTGTYRPNLRLSVAQLSREEDKFDHLLEFLRQHPGAGLVYTATVRSAEQVFEQLESAGESVGLYHGRLPAEERRRVQDDFMEGRLRVMVATNAFGLGIDKGDTRFVLHYQMPSGLDSYYQEAGRAGRDGEDAACSLLYVRGDKSVQQFFLAGRYPSVEDILGVYQALNDPVPTEVAQAAWTLDSLQAALKRPRGKLKVVLNLLERQKIISAHGAASSSTAGLLKVLQPGLPVSALQELLDAYKKRRDDDQASLEGMVFYAQTGHCRWQTLLSHFEDDALDQPCGRCDNCQRMARHESDAAAAARQAEQEPVGVPEAPFQVGDRVRAKRYGEATVLRCDGLTVTLAFDEGAERCFQVDFVRPAAKRKAKRKVQSLAAS